MSDCLHYARCEDCTHYHPELVEEEQCDKFGLPIGDGSAHCGEFQCTIEVCHRTNCIDEEFYTER